MNTQDKEEMIFELLDDFTSGGKLYYDDDEDSIWMINPETKEWIFELKKSGYLYYSYPIFVNIFKWISMEYPDFVPYIKKWVERIIQNEVKDTQPYTMMRQSIVERIIQNEVKDTNADDIDLQGTVERILQNEVKNTIHGILAKQVVVERILNQYDVISETNINSD